MIEFRFQLDRTGIVKLKILAFVVCAALSASAPYALANPGDSQYLRAQDSNENPSTTSADSAAIFNSSNGPGVIANTSGGIANADLYLNLSINMPSGVFIGGGDTYVPMTITYASNAVVSSDNNGGFASTSLDVNSFGGNDFHFGQSCFVGYAAGCGATGLVTQSFEFHYASKDYGILTIADLGLHLDVYAEGANASASLDPVIAFDPNAPNSYLFPDGFTVTSRVVTPASTIAGLPPGSPAPEPGSWLLMVLGVGAVGSALRGRRGFMRAGLASRA